MKNALLLLKISLLIFTLIIPLPSQASANGISKSKAVNIAQNIYSGRVLSVKRREHVFRVKILSHNGEVHIVRINANTAKVISKR